MRQESHLGGHHAGEVARAGQTAGLLRHLTGTNLYHQRREERQKQEMYLGERICAIMIREERQKQGTCLVGWSGWRCLFVVQNSLSLFLPLSLPLSPSFSPSFSLSLLLTSPGRPPGRSIS